MKKFARLGIALALIVLCTVSFAACGSAVGTGTKGLLRYHDAKGQMPTSIKTVDLGDDVDNINFECDTIVVYNTYKANGDLDKKFEMRNLKTGNVIPNIGHVDNVDYTVRGNHSVGNNKNFIAVWREFTVNGAKETHLGFFKKDGTPYRNFGFSKELYEKGTPDGCDINGTVFIYDNEVYNDGELIITGSFNAHDFRFMNNGEFLQHRYNNAVTLYDLKGNELFYIDGVTDGWDNVWNGKSWVSTRFEALSKNKGLIYTRTKTRLYNTSEFENYSQRKEAEDALMKDKNVTYIEGNFTHSSDNIYSVNIEYKVVDFKSGKMKTVDMPYKFDSFNNIQRLKECNDGAEKWFTKKAQNYSFGWVWEIQNKRLVTDNENLMSKIYFDENFNIVAKLDSCVKQIAKNRTYVCSKNNTSASIVDNNGKVLARFSGGSEYYGQPGLIQSNGNWFNADGKMVIRGSDYASYGWRGKFVQTTRNSDGKIGILTNTGVFTPFDDDTVYYNNTGYSSLNSALTDIGLYSTRKINSNAAQEFTIFNRAGTEMLKLDLNKMDSFSGYQRYTSGCDLNVSVFVYYKDSKATLVIFTN